MQAAGPGGYRQRQDTLPADTTRMTDAGNKAGEGIAALAEWMAGRPVGDRHKSLFWAGCRAAQDGLEPGPLIGAAVAAGLPRPGAEQTVKDAAATIAKARAQHRAVHPRVHG